MGKGCSSLVMDGLLDIISANVVKMSVYGTVAPTTVGSGAYGDAESTAPNGVICGALATHVLAGGDFSKADSGSSRVLTIAAQATLAINATGNAGHIALYSTVTNVLYYVTTCGTQLLDSTLSKVTVPAWTISVSNPS